MEATPAPAKHTESNSTTNPIPQTQSSPNQKASWKKKIRLKTLLAVLSTAAAVVGALSQIIKASPPVSDPPIPIPTQKLTATAQANYEKHKDEYATLQPHKAYAVSDEGWRGFSEKQPNELAAEQKALGFCRGFVAKSTNPQDKCWVIMVDDKKLGKW